MRKNVKAILFGLCSFALISPLLFSTGVSASDKEERLMVEEIREDGVPTIVTPELGANYSEGELQAIENAKVVDETEFHRRMEHKK